MTKYNMIHQRWWKEFVNEREAGNSEKAREWKSKLSEWSKQERLLELWLNRNRQHMFRLLKDSHAREMNHVT